MASGWRFQSGGGPAEMGGGAEAASWPCSQAAGPREPLMVPLRPPPGLRLLPSEPPASMLPGDTHSFFFSCSFFSMRGA